MNANFGRGGPDPRHEEVVELLGGYLDLELPQELRASVETHLADCTGCRRELAVQAAIRTRLQAEAVPAASSSLRERILHRLEILAGERRAGEPRAGERAAGRGRWGAVVGWTGWLVAASVAGLWVVRGHRAAPAGMSMTMGPAMAITVDSQPAQVVHDALADFRRVAGAILPLGTELDQVEAAVPFSVPALRSPHMRLIGSWTTELNGEPAAVLAYRCHNRLVVQYIVSERMFFRPPQVRQAIASAGLYAAGDGSVNAVAWPDLDSGSFLVGQFTPAELAAMRS